CHALPAPSSAGVATRRLVRQSARSARRASPRRQARHRRSAQSPGRNAASAHAEEYPGASWTIHRGVSRTAVRLTKMRFSVLLLPEEDGRYTVTVPALPGCVTYGSTVDQALERVRDAIQQYVASLEARAELASVERAPAELSLVEV